MRVLRRLAGGLTALFRRSRVERELDAELRDFLDAAIAQKMRAGASRADATRAARIEMGSTAAVRDRVRDVGWESIVESIWQDVRYGLRMLRRSPGFAATAIGILALGIGANTAIFSLLNAVMLRTLPVHEPYQLVEPLSRYPGDPRLNGYSLEFYEYVRDHNHVFAEVTGVVPASFKLTREGAEEETVDGEYVAGNLFSMLGMEPAIGRLIDPRDAEAGAAPVAVVNWSYWKSQFNLNPAILGTQIKVNGVPATIVGVTPRAFVGLQPGVVPAVWLPAIRPRGFRMLARLKPGVSIAQAQAEMNVLHRPTLVALAQNDPQWLRSTMEVSSAAAGFSRLRDRFAMPLQVLMAVVAFILLLACSNVASMLVARSAARRQEMAVRLSIGAGRLRLARQVLTESLLLSGAGSLLGIVLAYFGADALVRLMMSGRLPPGWPQQLELHLAPDARVLLFTAGVALLTGLFFGFAPAWSAFTSSPMSSLRETGSTGEKKAHRLFGQGLVIAQVALSVVLLSAAGLFVGHLSNLRNRDLGFQRHSVLLVTLNPQGSGYDRTQLSRLYRDLLGRLHAIPGVRSATLSGVTPIEGGAASRFASAEGHEENPADRRRVSLNWIAPKYFETLGTTLVAGRDFTFEDAGGPRVAIVNQAMARHYFGDASPIGRRLTLEREPHPYEIVGVVGDAKYSDLRDPAPRTVYLNAFQDGRISSRFALRTSVAPTAVVSQVRLAVDDVVKRVPIEKVTTLDDQINASIVLERVVATLSLLFGALGALLAAIGLYGLLAYTVTRRTGEIGLRLALGATERDVLRMVLIGALALVGLGIAVGVPLAWWTRRVASSVLENLSVTSAWPIAFAAVALLAVALVAAYLPARRAARVQPMDALRRSA